MRKADRIAGAALLAFAVAFSAGALKYYTYSGPGGPGPGFVPFWLGLIMAVLATLLLVGALRSDDPGAEFVAKILTAEIRPDDPASVSGFLSTLSAEEEAAASTLLEERAPEHAMTIVHDCWRELERRKIRRRLDAVQARLRAPDQALETIVASQKEILDLQKRLSDIARPFSPPL